MSTNLVTSAAGGWLISLCVLYFSAVYGSVLGISGMISEVLLASQKASESLMFLSGMIYSGWNASLTNHSKSALPIFLLSGFLVGFGTKLGNGCTSGHGLCGLARLSPRSIFAVVVFMSFGLLSRYFAVISGTTIKFSSVQSHVNLATPICIAMALALFSILACKHLMKHRKEFSLLARFIIGTLFANGLILGSMTNPDVVLSFLSLPFAFSNPRMFDPSLFYVLLAGLLPNMILHQHIIEGKVTALGNALQFPTNREINSRLFVGQACFGVGWGIAGICPGPAVVLLGQLISLGVCLDTYWIIYWWVGMISGLYVASVF